MGVKYKININNDFIFQSQLYSYKEKHLYRKRKNQASINQIRKLDLKTIEKVDSFGHDGK